MIRSTFLGFETAKSAIITGQAGLNTVGHNISNVSTGGYSRQRVDQVSLSYSNSGSLIRNSSIANVGLGVMATGVNRIRNEYLDTRYRQEASNYSAIATRVNALTEIDDILGEIVEDGLSVYLEKFLSALDLFSSDTSDTDLAATVRSEANTMTTMLNQYANKLKNQQAEQIEDLTNAVNTEANAIIQNIAYLNELIRQEHMYGNPANELMDSRDLLIDQLSEYCNIKVANIPEELPSGKTVSRMTITMVDSTVSPAKEYTLVDNGVYNVFQINADSKGCVSVALVDFAGGTVNEDVTNNFTAGLIKGYIDVINGQGDYAGQGENAYRGIQYYMKTLDNFANKFAEQMNLLNSITDAEANAANDSTINAHYGKNLFVAKDGSDRITASNITISEAWLAEVTYLTTTKTGQEVQVPVLDDKGNPTYEVTYDEDNNEIKTQVFKTTQANDNILKIIDNLKGAQHFTINNNDGVKSNQFTGSFASFLTNMQLDLGSDLSLQTTMLSASYTVLESYTTQRESISGVSIDEEAINLMTYQNYYNAACRFMTTVDEALNTIINGMGLVGR